jgi:hypothetical protein
VPGLPPTKAEKSAAKRLYPQFSCILPGEYITNNEFGSFGVGQGSRAIRFRIFLAMGQGRSTKLREQKTNSPSCIFVDRFSLNENSSGLAITRVRHPLVERASGQT